MDTVEIIQKLVRPYITILFGTAFIIGWLLGLVPTEVVKDLVIMVVSFWFGQRTASTGDTNAPSSPGGSPTP